MRPSRTVRNRAAVVAAVLVGGGLVSSTLAYPASASTTPPAPAMTPDPGAGPTAGPAPTAVDADRPVLVTLLGQGDAATPDPAVAASATAAAPAPAPAARPATASRAARPGTVSPVGGYRISARFGSSGSSWSSGRHTGLDFAASSGTPVRAVAAGRVVSAGWDGSYGRAVVIAHGDGTSTRYAHLSADSVGVGDRVGAGERIGRVGSSGNASGPHLHLEVLVGDRFTDPARWLRKHGVSI